MKLQKLEKIIRELFEKDMKLMREKNHDYSSDENCLENYNDFGLIGFAVRISDKYYRIKNIIQKGKHKVKGEPLEDSFRDIAVHSYIARAFLIEQNEGSDK